MKANGKKRNTLEFIKKMGVVSVEDIHNHYITDLGLDPSRGIRDTRSYLGELKRACEIQLVDGDAYKITPDKSELPCPWFMKQQKMSNATGWHGAYHVR